MSAYEELGKLLKNLGVEENFSKACPPSTVQVVLGIQVDTDAMTLSVTQDRLLDIAGLLR